MRVTFLHYSSIKLSSFEEFHTLFNVLFYITVTFLLGLGDSAKTESAELKAHGTPYRSDERLAGWGGVTSELRAKNYRQPVETHCDKDMHSWSPMAVFRARISWLVTSVAGVCAVISSPV